MNTFKKRRRLRGSDSIEIRRLPGIMYSLGRYKIRYKNVVCISDTIGKSNVAARQLEMVHAVQYKFRRFIRETYPALIAGPMIQAFDRFLQTKSEYDEQRHLNNATTGQGTSLQPVSGSKNETRTIEVSDSFEVVQK